MMSDVIVIGPNGLIGKRLTPILRSGTRAVRTVGRSANVDVRFDWDDVSSYRQAMEGGGALYLAPPTMVADPSSRVHELLRVAKSCHVQRVVAVSSLGVTFPTEPAGSGRRRYESAIMSSGLDWALLRPSGFMQNFSEGFMLPAIRSAGIIPASVGLGKAALVDCGDIAAVAAVLLRGAGPLGRTFEITGPAAIGFDEMAETISAAFGRRISYRSVTEEEMANMMRGAGVPDDYAAILLRDQRAIREGYAANVSPTVLDISRREPTSFAAFVSQNAKAWL